MTKILITSGGTITPIDPVRNIGNMSSGRLGSEIARSALIAGLEVTYLAAKNARSPFSYQADYNISPNLDAHVSQLKAIQALHQQYHHQYHELRYQTYDDYSENISHLITKQQPDIIILAAAVSDYLVDNYSNDKIKSANSLTIKLKHAPKVISTIREMAPTSIIVGFKLLVNADENTLINAARESIQKNKLDLCVANDLMTIKNNRHQIVMIDADGNCEHHSNQLGQAIINACLKKVSK
jgi:phosphopantothenate--cysteine ligase